MSILILKNVEYVSKMPYNYVNDNYKEKIFLQKVREKK